MNATMTTTATTATTAAARTRRLLVAIIAILAAVSAPQLTRPARADLVTDAFIPVGVDYRYGMWCALQQTGQSGENLLWIGGAASQVYGTGEAITLFVPTRAVVKVSTWFERRVWDYPYGNFLGYLWDPLPNVDNYEFAFDNADPTIVAVDGLQYENPWVQSTFVFTLLQGARPGRSHVAVNGYVVGEEFAFAPSASSPTGWAYVYNGMRRVPLSVVDQVRGDDGGDPDQLKFLNRGTQITGPYDPLGDVEDQGWTFQREMAEDITDIVP